MVTARGADGDAGVGDDRSGTVQLLPGLGAGPAGAGRSARDRPARTGLVALSMVVVLLLLTTGGYLGVTWARAQEVCAQDVAVRGDDPSPTVAVDWSWHPVGVRCTWGDDGSRTSLWWGGHAP